MAKDQPQLGPVYVALESFSVNDSNNVPHGVVEGDTAREGSWILEGRKHLFKLLVPRYEVEQATAAPGEKRGA